MPEPFQERQAVPLISDSDKFLQPRIICAVTTFVAIPIWLVGVVLVVGSIKTIDNPAGIPIYMFVCLLASVFVVPINTKIVAPILARFASNSLARAVLVHSFFSVFLGGGLGGWHSIGGKTTSLSWSIIPFYLAVFLIPPLLIGSFAYSMRSVALCRRMGSRNWV